MPITQTNGLELHLFYETLNAFRFDSGMMKGRRKNMADHKI